MVWTTPQNDIQGHAPTRSLVILVGVILVGLAPFSLAVNGCGAQNHLRGGHDHDEKGASTHTFFGGALSLSSPTHHGTQLFPTLFSTPLVAVYACYVIHEAIVPLVVIFS